MDNVEQGCTSGPCGYYRDGVVTAGISESCVGWFRRSGGVWAVPPSGAGGGGGGDGDGGGPWEAFSAREVGRGRVRAVRVVGWFEPRLPSLLGFRCFG